MTETALARKTTLPRGSFAKIARRLRPKVSVVHVRSVFLGQTKSARVERAIQNYIRRLERKSA